MNVKNLIGQHMFIGISGHALTAEEKKFIVENDIGGICLFGRNVSTPDQVYDLCEEIQSLSKKQTSKAPIFIGIDMEGGRVHRLKPPFTQWPALKYLGDLDAPTASFQFANMMGTELMSVGINLDFAPCTDTYSNPLNTVIGDRSISTDPEMVAKHASALIRGYMKSGIITCAKHFPGHGNTLVDSHLDLPVEPADLQRLKDFELIPFIKSFRSKVDMVMTSHIQFPNIDAHWPVTLSEYFIQDLLRDYCGYQGLVITDDLGMKAMSDHFGVEEVPVRALKAGVDLLLYCNDPEVPPIAYEAILEAMAQGSLSSENLKASYSRIMDFKRDKLNSQNPYSKKEALEICGCSSHQQLAQDIRNLRLPQVSET